VLRLGIVLMGLEGADRLLRADDLAADRGVAAVTLPSAFFVTHALATRWRSGGRWPTCWPAAR
jgi:hypothetical protein